MGMAASQARFLGLTARKTNVEYEGQQINQQRTALGNQTANYYNQMLGMSVPVPPSIDNYTKTLYTFNDGALTNSITALIANSSGNGLYNVSYLKEWVDDFSVVSAASSIVTNVEQLRANVLAAASAANTVANTVTVAANAATSAANAVASAAASAAATATTTTASAVASAAAAATTAAVSAATGVSAEYVTSATDAATSAANAVAAAASAAATATTTTASAVASAAAAATTAAAASAAAAATAAATTAAVSAATTGVSAEYVTSATDAATSAANAVAAAVAAAATATGADAASVASAAANAVATYNANVGAFGDGYKIGTANLYTLGSSSPSTVSRQEDTYWNSLVPDEQTKLIQQENDYLALLQQKYTTADWMVRYVQNTSTGAWVPTFYKVSDLNDAIYDNNSNSLSHIPAYTVGAEKKTEEIKNMPARIEQDSTGRLINITIGTSLNSSNALVDPVTYALTTNTVADQDRYNDAMNQYEYEKYQYDQTINDINAKIAIIQAQDKNLELRLKQLDTEQNAIQTEMDAVSKVIQKNVESTFKTFG